MAALWLPFFLPVTFIFSTLFIFRGSMYRLIGRILLCFSTALTISILLLQPGNGKQSLSETELRKRLYQLTPLEINALIKNVIEAYGPTTEKIAVYSGLALGTPYARDCLGEGTEGRCDKDPLIDFTRVDCLTFCEQILALAISKDYKDTLKNLQKIRYRNGAISFHTRNHFVMADWIIHNQWLLKNLTEEYCGTLCKEMIKTIDRRTFAASKGCADTDSFPPAETVKIHYLPKQHLLSRASGLKGSEMMILITTREGIFASHLGFIVKGNDGSLAFRHASSIHNKVIDEPFNQLYRRILKDECISGLVFLSIRDHFTIPPA